MKKAIILLSILAFGLGIYFMVRFSKKSMGLKNYPVKGIDVSHHQNLINWNEVKKDNVHFCIIKATEGKGFVDHRFKYNSKQAKLNNISVGAYHYYRFKNDVKSQFLNYTAIVSKNSIDFPPVIDVEYCNNPELRDSRNKAKFINDLKELMSMLENHYGKKTILYTDVNFYNDLLKGEINSHLWMSDLRKINPGYLDSSQWVFWQYSMRGNKKGINGNVDLNVFNGDMKKLNELMLD